MGIELKTKTGHITLTAPKTVSGGSVDLSNYYTKDQTDEQISSAVSSAEERVDFKLSSYALNTDLEEAIASIPQPDLTEYVTESELEGKDYATKAEIPDTSSFVTATYVQTAINENAPDLSNYAKTTDIPDVSAYQTEAQVIALIEEYGGGTLPVSEEGEF